MDRRHFLAVSSLAAASPMLAQTTGTGTPVVKASNLSRQVDFTTDGLGLNPGEYAAQLHEAVSTGNFESDYYSNGGVIAELEKKFAKHLGKEAAIFLPTGTLANHLAVRKLAGGDRRILVQAESHFYNDSGDCAETLSDLNLIPLAQGRSTIELAEVRQWVERSAGGRVPSKVGVISIESPVRRRNHEMVDFDELQRVCAYAREQGIRLHMDGARMFNLPLHSGKSVKDYAALFDSVYVSLWKHFNAASGAILAGDAKFIEGLFHVRRMFGGSLPHAWPQVAVASQYVDSYEADYAKAWKAAGQLIVLLQQDARFKIEKMPNGTSKFLLSISGITPELISERALKRGLLLPHTNPDDGIFQMQVNPTILRTTPTKLARAFVDSMKS
ncbi:MAG: beta-eliminating lyase-related protein [Arenimonas sp.]